MNLLLLEPDDTDAVVVDGRRHRHLRDVLRVAEGDRVRVGRVGGRVGEAVVEQTSRHQTRLLIQALAQAPPPKASVSLVIALCRPPVLKRVIAAATAMGVGHIVLLGAKRVEKSFWNSEAVTPESLREAAVLGLEQARDTVLPNIELQPKFKPFVEDELSTCPGPRFVAHPDASQGCPVDMTEHSTLVVGPEGGWIPFELEALRRAGCRRVSLGWRPLRTENAVSALLGRLILPNQTGG